MINKMRREENKQIYKRRDESYSPRPRTVNKHPHKQNNIGKREPTRFNWNEEKQPKLIVRIQNGKRDKQRQIDVSVRGITRNKSRRNCTDCPKQIVRIKAECTPMLLKRRSDKPIKIKRNNNIISYW